MAVDLFGNMFSTVGVEAEARVELKERQAGVEYTRVLVPEMPVKPYSKGWEQAIFVRMNRDNMPRARAFRQLRDEWRRKDRWFPADAPRPDRPKGARVVPRVCSYAIGEGIGCNWVAVHGLTEAPVGTGITFVDGLRTEAFKTSLDGPIFITDGLVRAPDVEVVESLPKVPWGAVEVVYAKGWDETEGRFFIYQVCVHETGRIFGTREIRGEGNMYYERTLALAALPSRQRDKEDLFLLVR